MDAKELRIGNLVSASGKEFQVGWIGWSGIGSDKVDANHEDVEGIPLTPEWLERFGFKKEVSTLGLPNEFRLILDIDGDNRHEIFATTAGNEMWACATVNNFWASNNISYVHQLQNLYFALTGKELQISEP